MKRNITLTMLFCVLGAFALMGCNKANENTTTPASTNAPVTPSTNTAPK